MIFYCYADSPLGRLTLASQNGFLIGLWMEGQKYYFPCQEKEETCYSETNGVLLQAKDWLDCYFQGRNPFPSDLPLKAAGTPFSQVVYSVLLSLPYGQTATYQEVAEKVAFLLKKKSMSCQAVGQAISHNPLGIIIPCHRVIGSDGSLKGYAGGLIRKQWLLEHEKETGNDSKKGLQ